MTLAVSLAACGGGGEQAEAQDRAAPARAAAEGDAPRTVRVARVETRPLAGGLEVSGVFVAREEAAVGTEIAGYRISRVLADEGQYVTRGQTLAVLDPTLINADVATQRAQVTRADSGIAQARATEAQAQAALQQAQVNAAQAAGEAARVAGLDGQGVLSQEAIDARRSAAAAARAAVGSSRAQVEAARAAVASAQADANSARAQLSQVQTRQSRTAVTSPVSGRVLERNARPGDISGGAAAPMFRIARDGLIELDAEVPEAQLARVRSGDGAIVTLPGGGTVNGVVRYIDPTVDPATRLGRARIALPPRADLRPGGFARGALTGVGRAARVVPEAALRFTAEGPAVYTVAGDRRVRRVPVRTGARANGYVELVQGPPDGAMVILGGSAFVLEGDVVRPQLVAVEAGGASAPASVGPRAQAPSAPPQGRQLGAAATASGAGAATRATQAQPAPPASGAEGVGATR